MIGQTLAHYRIVDRLGKGGMGEVFIAEDLKLKRRVALKILSEETAKNEAGILRFQREAEAVAALNHPGIVTIYSVEESDGKHFLTMELIEGESLDQRLSPEGLDLREIFDIAIPLAEALAAAHARGIVHRDLKPSNIMLNRDKRVKVLDFGLAKLIEKGPGSTDSGEDPSLAATADQPLTSAGTIVGTTLYMSPEQLTWGQIDHRTDIFSLGIVLYEMATGSRPFKGASSIELSTSILRDPPPPLPDSKADLPRQLSRIIYHCLEKDPARRFQSALDVRNELEGLRREMESGEVLATTGGSPARPLTPTPSPPSAAIERPRRRWAWPAIGAAVVALALAAGWWMTRGASTPAIEGPASVAVLPFTNLSGEETDYFALGMTSELLQALAEVEELRVPSQTVIFALRGREPKEMADIGRVGKSLDVESLVVGTVRQAGKEIDLFAQLVRVLDGEVLWSGAYQRVADDDVFTVQKEIAESIASALRVTLAPGGLDAGTSNFEAYDAFLRGHQYTEQQTKAGFRYACEMYQRAVDLDPLYVRAYTGLARCHHALYATFNEGDFHREEVARASRRALDLAPDLGESHLARAYHLSLTGTPEEAEREFETAIRIDPKLGEAFVAYGNFMFKNKNPQRAAELWERAIEIDPDDLRPIRLLPQVYRSLGWKEQLERANRHRVAAAERRIALKPDDIAMRLAGASSLMELGERERAFEWADHVVQTDTDDVLILYNTACFFAIAGQVDKAIEALERAYAAGDREASYWREDSDLAALRDDPRFLALLERMEADPEP